MCSIHANSARDALAKLCTLPLFAGRNIDSKFVVPTVASSMNVVVHCELQRRVVEIVAASGQSVGSVLEASSIFALRDGELQATGAIRHAPQVPAGRFRPGSSPGTGARMSVALGLLLGIGVLMEIRESPTIRQSFVSTPVFH